MAGAAGLDRRGINGINITPMVDIILVLLVIFMVTSSAMDASEAIEVDKPEAASGNPSSSEEPALLSVTCDKEGSFYVGEDRLENAAALEARAKLELKKQPKLQAVLRCDRAAQVETLVTAIDSLRLAGIRKYAIATDPVERQGQPG